ncbi:Fic family protein [Patescibacteria group bacterium]
MLKPVYNLSQSLLQNITQIERLYGQLEALKIPKQLEVNLERDNLIQSSYVSNSIEGNPLSLRDVTNLLLDDRVPTNRDEKEVTNYFDILKNLKNYADKPITLDIVNQIHDSLMTGVRDEIAGEIRDKKIVIGKYQKSEDKNQDTTLEVKHEPPSHNKKQIQLSLIELIDWLGDDLQIPVAIKAGIFHHHFVYIHPYVDGNGRVCRLLTALIFLKNNYHINKYFVLDDYYDIDRHQYSDKLHTADEGDKTEWLEYFTEGVGHSLKAALARIKEADFQLDIETRPTKKEREVIEIFKEKKQLTSTDLLKILKVSRQQAHNLLKSLVEKGFLTKKGKTKKSFYFLK